MLGLALMASPLAFLAGPHSVDVAGISEVTDTPEALDDAPVSKTSLGRFLETEIAERIERVSGKTLAKSVRIKRSREIASAVAEAAYTFDVDPFLILSMIEVESRYNTMAVGTHGEIGLMQIKPSTARWVAPVTDALWSCDLHEVRCNIMMGSHYVGHLQHKTDRLREELGEGELTTTASFREYVLRSYNLGPAKAKRMASNRIPATEADGPSYADKIANRADRFRHRYIAMEVATIH